jgi:hypothetical protein
MEAATAPNAIKPITRILMFPPLSELSVKRALLDKWVPGANRAPNNYVSESWLGE